MTLEMMTNRITIRVLNSSELDTAEVVLILLVNCLVFFKPLFTHLPLLMLSSRAMYDYVTANRYNKTLT